MAKNKNHFGKKTLSKTVSLFFSLIGISFIFASFSILFFGIWKFVECYLLKDCDVLNNILNMASYLIIAVAIFDVGRNLLEEEVFRHYQMRSPKEARRSLTKFLVIILVAVTLESLIALIKAGTSNIRDLIYPAIMFTAASFLLASFGLYQRLSVIAEIGVDKKNNQNKNEHIL